MIDNLVDVVAAEPAVGPERVRVDRRTGLDHLPNTRLKRPASDVRHDLCSDGAAPLDHAEDGTLVDTAGSRDLLSADVCVHVPRLTADEGLVHLDCTGELLEGPGLHGEPNAVEHEPRGLLSHAERAAEFVRGDAVLGVGDEPNGGEPLVEAERGVLEDRPDLDGDLLLTALALPDSAGSQVGVLGPLAAGADGAVGPAELGDELRSYV